MYFLKELKKYIDSLQVEKMDKDKMAKLAVKGTVIMAIKYNKGVLIAGDMRVTRGYDILQEDFYKIYPISGGKAVIAIAGVVAFAIKMIGILNLEIEHFEKREETELSFDAQANLLSQIVSSFLPLVFNGIVVAPILASQDKIYGYDPLGARYERNIWITGSGESFAQGSLDDDWDPQSKTKNDAVKMAVKALKKAQKNAGVGPGRVIYLIENKIRKLTEEDIKNITGGE